MTIDLNRLDGIKNEDEALNALQGYITDLVEEFVNSPEGDAYLQAQPELENSVGSWIDHLLYFGYVYRSVTLPHLTKADVEAIVTDLFPKKIAILDPEEANTTIPELIAFWQFLKRAYKHPKATQILKVLQKIQPQFQDLMNNPSNFGIAKSFFSAGMTAGFDMTTEEGLQAFQAQYNQSLGNQSLGNQNLGKAQAEEAPSASELAASLDSLNSALDQAAGALPQNFQQLFNTIAQLVNAHPGLVADTGLEDGPEDEEWRSPRSVDRSLPEQSGEMEPIAAEELPPLSDETIALLQRQTITATEPGTIVRDFQTLLDFIGDGVPVSSTNSLLSQKLLGELNQRLSHLLQIDLKRPVQKSYPPINGLYLLLRASGLGQIVTQGKKATLILNPELFAAWNRLNPTEQYFTLFETWMLRAHDEILGERSGGLTTGTKCIQFWQHAAMRDRTFKNYAEQQTLNYWPELHNLALLQLFGLMQVESEKPEAGKGWRIKRIQQLPLGDALMQVVGRSLFVEGLLWDSDEDLSARFGQLQPALQPYFPEWQHTLVIPSHEFREGLYTFKVSLGSIWRRLAISSDQTLFTLSRLILQSVDFDSDHLDMFRYKNAIGRTVEVSHPYADGGLYTDEVRVGDLPIAEGASMTYIFDFGDWWEFQVQLERIQPEDERSEYAAIIEQHGQAPSQYPNWG